MWQITVMSGPERHRRWTDEERLRILAEAGAPGACVADVARRHDISTARIYTWRNKLLPQITGPEFAEAIVKLAGPRVTRTASSNFCRLSVLVFGGIPV